MKLLIAVTFIVALISFLFAVIATAIIFWKASRRHNSYFDFTTENDEKIIVQDKETINKKVRR
jgi:hypothetical protein